MNAAVLDFPPLDAEPATQPRTSIATIEQSAIAPLEAIRTDLVALAAKYDRVAFDVATPKGLDAARAARHDLRENGRFAVNRAVKRFKDDANAAKKKVEALGVELVAITQPREEEIDAIVVRREDEIEDEREAARLAEQARMSRRQAALNAIDGFLNQARQPGMTALRLATGIKMLNECAVDTMLAADDTDDQFLAQAQMKKVAVLTSLGELHLAAVGRELEAQRLAEQRAEQQRVAEEQAERQRQLDEQAAELRRQQEALEAQTRATALAEQQRCDAESAAQNSQRQESAPATALAHQTAVSGAAGAQAEGEGVSAPSPGSSEIARWQRTDSSGQVVQVVVSVPTVFPQVATPEGDKGPAPTLNLGKLCGRLGFIVSAELLGTLGFAAVVQRSSRLFHEADYPRICAALAEHCLHVGGIEQGSPRLAPAARDVIDALNSLSDPEGELSCIAPGPEREELMTAWTGLCEALSAAEGHAL
jgi:hypothetical protein